MLGGGEQPARENGMLKAEKDPCTRAGCWEIQSVRCDFEFCLAMAAGEEEARQPGLWPPRGLQPRP